MRSQTYWKLQMRSPESRALTMPKPSETSTSHQKNGDDTGASSSDGASVESCQTTPTQSTAPAPPTTPHLTISSETASQNNNQQQRSMPDDLDDVEFLKQHLSGDPSEELLEQIASTVVDRMADSFPELSLKSRPMDEVLEDFGGDKLEEVDST